MPPLNTEENVIRLADVGKPPAQNLGALLRELSSAQGAARWAALERLAAHPGFTAYLQQEHPRWAAAAALNRRDFLRLSAAAMAAGGLAGCGRPVERSIVPEPEAAPARAAGQPHYYATALCLDGYATGVLAESHEGRPTKIEGNPGHPASLGGTFLHEQAAVLDVWDPDRSQTPVKSGNAASWREYENEALALREKLRSVHGRGLHLVLAPQTSPTLEALLQHLQQQLPAMRRYSWQAWPRSNVFAGTQRVFGRPLEPLYRFDKAKVIVALDADFLGRMPGGTRYARDFADGRRVHDAAGARMNRLYALEPTASLTGLMADNRLTLPAAAVEDFARSLAARLGVASASTAALPGDVEHGQAWLDALTEDLQSAGRAALVVAGEAQPPAVHALAHAINDRLGARGNTVDYIEPVVPADDPFAQMRELVRAMNAGEVDTLLMFDINPVYDAPADLRFAEALRRVPHSHHLGLYPDETAVASQWHLPMAHALEIWSDARAYDGTISLVQPLMQPLYGGRSVHELVALWSGNVDPSGHQLVQDYWRGHGLKGKDFDSAWLDALRNGLIADSAAPLVTPRVVAGFDVPSAGSRPAAPAPASASAAAATATKTAVAADVRSATVEVVFRPDPMLHDGRYANNGWLQELPSNVTGLSWGNALLLSRPLARQLGIKNGDELRVEQDGYSLVAPAYVMPAGQARTSVTVILGQGRRNAGRIGNGVGYDGYALRRSGLPWFGGGATVTPTRRQVPLTGRPTLTISDHEPARSATLAQFQANEHVVARSPREDGPFPSMYPDWPRGRYAWAMSVDLNSCIGCGVCTLACQAENNIPIVGAEQVRLGRAMHWIRVDTYHTEKPQQQEYAVRQPVPCMHCEHAPCELVCPVEATVHNSDGLNLQIYNRCIGTRWCSNNCPYKVRRFNFLEYSDYATESLKGQRNPEVTVRSRGVMEKCTYCVQRIRVAEIQADKDDRHLGDGEVRTACQDACPTNAIVFGDIQDPNSEVSHAKSSPLDYVLLAEENTRPRTTYSARLRNPHPRLDALQAAADAAGEAPA